MNIEKTLSGLFYFVGAGILYNFGVIDFTIEKLVYRSYPEGEKLTYIYSVTWLFLSFIVFIITGLIELKQAISKNNSDGCGMKHLC